MTVGNQGWLFLSVQMFKNCLGNLWLELNWWLSTKTAIANQHDRKHWLSLSESVDEPSIIPWPSWTPVSQNGPPLFMYYAKSCQIWKASLGGLSYKWVTGILFASQGLIGSTSDHVSSSNAWTWHTIHLLIISEHTCFVVVIHSVAIPFWKS